MVTQLRQYMKRKGITQTQFAKMLGTTKFTLSRWMNGQNEPSQAYKQIIESVIGKTK